MEPRRGRAWLGRRLRLSAAIGFVLAAGGARLALGPGNNGAGCSDTSIMRSGVFGVLFFPALFLLATLIRPERHTLQGQASGVKVVLAVLSLVGFVVSCLEAAGLHVGVAAACH